MELNRGPPAYQPTALLSLSQTGSQIKVASYSGFTSVSHFCGTEEVKVTRPAGAFMRGFTGQRSRDLFNHLSRGGFGSEPAWPSAKALGW